MDPVNLSLPLVVAYVLPVVLLVWVWLSSSTSGRLKLLLTLCLPLIYWAHWQGLQHLRGWPADEKLPERFELIAADVVEPTPEKSISGNINLWIRLVSDGEPRAYALPYTRRLHQSLYDTKQRMQAGQRQFGRLYDASSPRGADIGNNQKLEFQNASRALLPPK